MLNGWLFKTEPSAYSFPDLERDRRTVWDGVKNPVALKHLAAIRKGDRVFIYHTGDEKAVIGTATAESSAYPDPKARDPKQLAIDISVGRRLPRPVGLAEVKRHPPLQQWELARLPRL